jgi:hypothetical protein
MKNGAEPIQQPIRKRAGSPLTPARRFAHLEDLAAFHTEHVPGAFARAEGGYPPAQRQLQPGAPQSKFLST